MKRGRCKNRPLNTLKEVTKLTTLKEALRLVGVLNRDTTVHIIPIEKAEQKYIYGKVLSMKEVKDTYDLKRTMCHRIDYDCFNDGQFLYWEFYVDER